MTTEEAAEKAAALLNLLESDFGQSGRDVRLLAIRDELLAASRAHTGEIPGYVRVPREPTQKMIRAGIDAALKNGYGEHIYAAMISAALEDGETKV